MTLQNLSVVSVHKTLELLNEIHVKKTYQFKHYVKDNQNVR
jgi:hypothetical protein